MIDWLGIVIIFCVLILAASPAVIVYFFFRREKQLIDQIARIKLARDVDEYDRESFAIPIQSLYRSDADEAQIARERIKPDSIPDEEIVRD